MSSISLTEENLNEGSLIDKFSEFISFDEVNKVLEIKNLTLRSLDTNGRLLYRIINQISHNVEVDTVVLQNVKFQAGNLYLDIANKLILKACIISGPDSQEFGMNLRELEIIDCNVPEFNFDLDASSLLISGSSLGTINIISYVENGPRVKVINIQGRSTIRKITGLHFLLSNEANTVVIFSQDSQIVKDAEASYRIMRLISNKFGDVVQSHIFHTHSVELYATHADNDTKVLLFFEKWTNNFGRSIFRPLIWMLTINYLFLISLLAFSDVLFIKDAIDFLGSMFNISPLSSLVPEEISRTSWEFSFDSIRRVLLAILTYQVIVSARRFSYVKK